jgi:choline dehydrogenase-like flavoprotein
MMKNCIYGTESFEKRAEKYKVVTRDVVIPNVDVCVIGSGAGGAVIAAKLAEAGKSVVILERGGYYDGESMNQREADMIPLLWKNGGANFTSSLRIAVAQGSCLGGSTVINDAVCFRIPDLVIDEWRKNGVSITKTQWDKANAEVEKRIHVAEVTEDELNENAKMLRKACQNFQIEGKPIKHSKNKRNCGQSFTNQDLHSCVKCGFCHLGCHYDTKQSMLVTYIHDALNNPKADFTAFCDCEAQRITFQNGIATGVDGIFLGSDGQEKYRIRVNAKVIIVSAGAIASSNLLQRSRIGGPDVGKGLALHPAAFVMGKFDKEINGNQGIPMSYTCHEFGVTNKVEKGGFLIESIFLPVFQTAVAFPAMLMEHFAIKNFNYHTMAGIMVRDESVGTISTTYSGRPKVKYNPAESTVNDLARGIGILARMWFDVGATSVITPHNMVPEINTRADVPRLRDAVRNDPDNLRLGSAHPQGGNKMGNDKSECIVDPDCKVFGFKNLFVCDASVFPSALGVNPQQTVMALATIIANNIIKKWKLFSPVKASLGNTCDKTQPRFCKTETIGEMFSVTDHDSKLFEKLGNSTQQEVVVGKNWKFDPDKLLIYNNLYWKGFYWRDADALTNVLRYFGGFYKRFSKEKASDTFFKGITHPFETQIVDAKSIAREKELPGHGKVIHLEYVDFPFSTAYDILKMIDKNTIIGKAFLGNFGKGRELFNFSMSRVYDINFITEVDLIAMFNDKNLSHVPTGKEIAGTWEGMMVSDSAVTPRTQVFRFDYEDGEVDMRYSFANMLHGISDVSIVNQMFRFDDPTPFHDEIRMVTPDVMIGRWVTDWSSEDVLKPYVEDLKRILPIPIAKDAGGLMDKLANAINARGISLPKEAGISFLNVENDKKMGTRIGLSYLLKRISK